MSKQSQQPVSRVGKAFSTFVSLLNGAGSILILCLVALINLDVLSRYAFNAPISGVTELVELSIVAIVFLQIADAVRAGRMTRSDGLYSRLCQRHPRAGHVLGALFDIAGAVFFLTIVIGGIPRFVDAWQRGYFSGIRGVFVVPVWPVRLVLVIGAVSVMLVLVGLARRHISALIHTRGRIR